MISIIFASLSALCDLQLNPSHLNHCDRFYQFKQNIFILEPNELWLVSGNISNPSLFVNARVKPHRPPQDNTREIIPLWEAQNTCSPELQWGLSLPDFNLTVKFYWNPLQFHHNVTYQTRWAASEIHFYKWPFYCYKSKASLSLIIHTHQVFSLGYNGK